MYWPTFVNDFTRWNGFHPGKCGLPAHAAVVHFGLPTAESGQLSWGQLLVNPYINPKLIFMSLSPSLYLITKWVYCVSYFLSGRIWGFKLSRLEEIRVQTSVLCLLLFTKRVISQTVYSGLIHNISSEIIVLKELHTTKHLNTCLQNQIPFIFEGGVGSKGS